jgi:hydrogenase-4 component E
VVAVTTGQTHLYWSAGLTLVLKAVLLPWILHRLVRRLEVKWDVEPLIKVPTTMLVGIALVIISFNVALPISQLSSTVSRGTLGIALASVMLAFLMMITRSKAIPQVVGFLAMENGLFLAATSATYGMPMVVELGIALDVLVGAIILGVFFFQIREQFDSLDIRNLEKLKEQLMDLFVLDPRHPPRQRRAADGGGRARLGAQPQHHRQRRHLPRLGPAHRRDRRRRAALRLRRAVLHRLDERLLRRADRLRRPDHQHLLRPLHAQRAEHGKLTAPRLRLYKSMFQLFMFTMLAALTTNNLGILWVAMEAATLTTVLLVSLYRTPASLEAAWKYFILCGVGIAQALFGTILLYFAAERVLGETGNALLWTTWSTSRASSSRPSWRWPSSSCWSATAPRSAWRRCTTGCPMPMRKARRRSRRCSPACCSTSPSTPSCAARCWPTAPFPAASPAT